jgi:hypothetical protein
MMWVCAEDLSRTIDNRGHGCGHMIKAELTSKSFLIANAVTVAPPLTLPTLDGMSQSRSYKSA